MEIKYQIELKNNPEISSAKTPDYVRRLEPLTEEQIVSLETNYNSNRAFPASLRELLFLAGKSCYVLDYGLFETQEDLQDFWRAKLIKRNVSFTRSFFVIDQYSEMAYVYLDEGVDDPFVYVFTFDEPPMNTGLKLTELINSSIGRLKSGRNPF